VIGLLRTRKLRNKPKYPQETTGLIMRGSEQCSIESPLKFYLRIKHEFCSGKLDLISIDIVL